jgi:hypothetical protein
MDEVHTVIRPAYIPRPVEAMGQCNMLISIELNPKPFSDPIYFFFAPKRAV